jgi:hypothetical protein
VALREITLLTQLDAYVLPAILIVIGAFLVVRAIRPR